MFVFTFAFWIAILPLVLLHAMAGRRWQQWLILVASLVIYGSFNPVLLIMLALVVLASWGGIKATYYTDDEAMLRFTRALAAGLTLLPLVAIRLTDDVANLVNFVATRLSLLSEPWSVGVLVPVGTAFYSLQAIEGIYARRPNNTRPTFLEHALFVSFFPTVFIGPVQRHEQLAPQLTRRRRVTRIDVDLAAIYILFGLFWKLVVADNLLPISDRTFADSGSVAGAQVILGAVAFAVGITANLAGYTAMVVGVARLFGIRLNDENVRRPYLARSPLDFWSRWLTSVSDWMYRRVYLGIVRNRPGTTRVLFAVVITLFVGAWWHGDGLPVLVWGGLHAVAILLQLWFRRRRTPSTSRVLVALKTIVTFGFVSYSWIWFLSESLADAARFHLRMLTPSVTSFTLGIAMTIGMFFALLIVSDMIFHAVKQQRLQPATKLGTTVAAPLPRGLVFATMVAGIVVLSTPDLHSAVLGIP